MKNQTIAEMNVFFVSSATMNGMLRCRLEFSTLSQKKNQQKQQREQPNVSAYLKSKDTNM